MTVPPLPEETPPPSVSQTNHDGHNFKVEGTGHHVAGRDIHNYYGPIEQLPPYQPTQESPTLKPAYIPLSPSKPHSVHTEQDARNRAQLMDNVYHTWIEGVLFKNLKAGEIEIGKELKPNAVLTDAAENAYRLSAEDLSSIETIFARLGHQLLILGRPGSGKTIHLLDLAHHLLGMAQRDDTQPVPVVLNLSSWTPDTSFERWLLNELKRVYGVPETTGRTWLDHRKLALLLDGLDEIGRKRSENERDNNVLREQCIEAINDYCHPPDQKGADLFPVQVCVCSRYEDYFVLKRRLMIHNAIVLRDLSEAVIHTYLEGEAWSGTRELIQRESSAQDMAKVPFLLNTMKTAYANIPYDTGTPPQGSQLKLAEPSKARRRNHLFGMYVRLQIKNAKSEAYSPQKTLHYLQWLAYQMTNRKMSVFYIEDFQPSMSEQENRFNWLSYLILGLLFGLILMFTSETIWGLVGGAVIAIPASLGPINIRERAFFSFNIIDANLDPNISWRPELMMGISFPLNKEKTGVFTWEAANILKQQQVGLGLRTAVKQVLRSSLIFGLILSTIFAIREGFSAFIDSSPIASLLLGLVLSAGIIRHLTLRYLLAREGSIPPIHHFSITGGYDIFLDHAAELGLLRKVGGGYIFRHRMLMDYLAEQYEKDHPLTTAPVP